MSGLSHRSILRWKEWIPLITQQLRLRNLLQVIAYNIQVPGDIDKKKRKKTTYYYTLHLTAMSSPFYTSEQLESENPKWVDLDIKCDDFGSANGVVIRLWAHIPDDEEDHVITVWGVYFSGLVYIGSQLGTTDSSSFCSNSVVLHMHGGYFSAPHCFVNPHPVTPRTLSIQLDAFQVKPSYTVKLLLRLQSLKHSIKKESQATSLLRDQIVVGMFSPHVENNSSNRGSATLRKLMSRNSRPKADPHQVHALKRDIEMAKFRVRLLGEQRDIVQVAVQKKQTEKNNILEKNQDRESELMENFCCLRRDAEKKRDLKLDLNRCKSESVQTTALLDMRRRELIFQLFYIYPITQLPDGRFTIREVYLPNSEDFEGKDELMISVALGYVAHLVQMISYFLNVPTRYPICHFGSRSKIIDHITDSIPDKEREFPLYSRGKERHSFNYGVYLLNKNIAQLRWYCGLTTSDLRHTLPNLHGLMGLNRKDEVKRCLELRRNQKRSSLSFSLDHGLNNVAVGEVNSDPQHYTGNIERRRVLTDRGIAPVHDLASLMLLDIPHPMSTSGSTLSNDSSRSRQEGLVVLHASYEVDHGQDAFDCILPSFVQNAFASEEEKLYESNTLIPPPQPYFDKSHAFDNLVLEEESPVWFDAISSSPVSCKNQREDMSEFLVPSFEKNKIDILQGSLENSSSNLESDPTTSVCDNLHDGHLETITVSSIDNSNLSKLIKDKT